MTIRSPFVPFAITVCGIEELYGHCATGVSHVLSLLDPGWGQDMLRGGREREAAPALGA